MKSSYLMNSEKRSLTMLLRASLSVPILLATHAHCQEKFVLKPEQMQSILKKNHLDESTLAFPVSYKEIEYKKKGSEEILKRSAYMVTGLSFYPDTLTGSFVKIPNHYRVVLKDVEDKYVKSELVITQYPNTDETSLRDYEVIQRINTDQYYFIVSDNMIVPLIVSETRRKEAVAIVRKLGYKEYEDEYGSLYVKTKTSEIHLDGYTCQQLEKDPNYISKLDADMQKLASLLKQAAPYSKNMDKYLSIYNIKGRRMATADLKAWRGTTQSAQKVQDQIYAITQKYDGNTSFKPFVYKELNSFLDNLLASKGVLGM